MVEQWTPDLNETEYMNLSSKTDGFSERYGQLRKMTSFKYLRSYVASEGRAQRGFNGLICVACSKWRKFSGVLCDVKVSRKRKSKNHHTVIRCTAMCGSEYSFMTKRGEMWNKRVSIRLFYRVINATIRKIMGIVLTEDNWHLAGLDMSWKGKKPCSKSSSEIGNWEDQTKRNNKVEMVR